MRTDLVACCMGYAPERKQATTLVSQSASTLGCTSRAVYSILRHIPILIRSPIRDVHYGTVLPGSLAQQPPLFATSARPSLGLRGTQSRLWMQAYYRIAAFESAFK